MSFKDCRIKRQRDRECWSCKAYVFRHRKGGLWAYCLVDKIYFPDNWNFSTAECKSWTNEAIS